MAVCSVMAFPFSMFMMLLEPNCKKTVSARGSVTGWSVKTMYGVHFSEQASCVREHHGIFENLIKFT